MICWPGHRKLACSSQVSHSPVWPQTGCDLGLTSLEYRAYIHGLLPGWVSAVLGPEPDLWHVRKQLADQLHPWMLSLLGNHIEKLERSIGSNYEALTLSPTFNLGRPWSGCTFQCTGAMTESEARGLLRRAQQIRTGVCPCCSGE